MANVNSIQRLYQGGTVDTLSALALGTSTTETSFSKNSLVVGSTTVKAAAPAILAVPDQGGVPMMWDNGKPFRIVGWGNCVTGASTNLTLKLYQVPASIVAAASLTNGTVTNLNAVATIANALAVNTTTGNFWFEAQFQWNSTSKLLQGWFIAETNLLPSPPVYAVTTSVTTATAFDTELNFILSATLSTGNAANIVNLMEMTIQGV